VAGFRCAETTSKTEDITDGVPEGENRLKPRELFELREIYNQHFDPDFFRNRICQETKASKRERWLERKAEKRAKMLKKQAID